MSALLRPLTLTYPDGRCLTDVELIALLKTIPGVGARYGEVLLAEAGLDVVTRFGKPRALEAFAGFDPSKTYSADKVLSSSSRIRWQPVQFYGPADQRGEAPPTGVHAGP